MNGPGPHRPLPLLDRPIAVLAAFNAPVTRAGRDIAAALIGCMVVLAVAQILSRAIFSHTLDWAEELARVALVWGVLLVAPYAYRSGANVAIGSFAHALPPRFLAACSAALNLLVAWICVMLLLESFEFWRRGLSLTASALPVRMSWIYSIVPVALAALVLVSAELVLRLLRSLVRPDPELTLAGAVPGIKED